jgi:predicted kinase
LDTDWGSGQQDAKIFCELGHSVIKKNANRKEDARANRCRMAHHAQGALFFISADAAIFKMLGVLVVLGATFLWVTILLLRCVRWHND